MRTPVNDPGPRPHATHAISSRATPHSCSRASRRGRSCVLEARCAARLGTGNGLHCSGFRIKQTDPDSDGLVRRVERQHISSSAFFGGHYPDTLIRREPGSVDHTFRSERARVPYACAFMQRMPSSSTAITISKYQEASPRNLNLDERRSFTFDRLEKRDILKLVGIIETVQIEMVQRQTPAIVLQRDVERVRTDDRSTSIPKPLATPCTGGFPRT